MATRYPLVLNSLSNTFEELQSGDTLAIDVLALQPNRISKSITIADGFNAVTYGPFEVDSSVTVQGGGNAAWIGL